MITQNAGSVPHTGCSAKLAGNKAICPGCMCQPEDHGGNGACGKPIDPIIDADEANEAILMVKRLRARRSAP